VVVVALAAWGALTPAVPAQVLMHEVPSALKGLEVVDKRGEKVPLDLPLVDEHGKAVRLGDFFNQPSADGKHNKPVVLMMVYFRCPMLCPLVLEKFRSALNEIDFTAGKDFNAVVVSFDPRDTPADAMLQKDLALAGYDRPIDDQVRAGWAYLTSTPENARKLGDAIGFPYRYLPESGEYSHGACVFVLTPEGKVSRYLTGLHYPVKDVRLALLDASNGRLANVFDVVAMWCYHFDPTRGQYTMAAMRVMQIGSAITVVLLGGTLALLWRTEWFRRRRALAKGTVHAVGADEALVGGRLGERLAAAGGGAELAGADRASASESMTVPGDRGSVPGPHTGFTP
jgi:protein SCO1/2